MPENDCILPPTNLIFLGVGGGRSRIETEALLHRASRICLLAEFPAQQQQLGWRKKTETLDRTNSIYHANIQRDANR
ncbi:hypothetical protein [Microcoleus sp. herbarium14]|uniref:hypothetical protein n=1 Tax=Microcoleus sp. herbarium14 TaxID=3055439 RepID=UPI002FD239C7